MILQLYNFSFCVLAQPLARTAPVYLDNRTCLLTLHLLVLLQMTAVSTRSSLPLVLSQ